jgi:hypothetical protein
MNPYVFIVGCPRSGTTLVQRLLNAHPEIAVINELQWVPGWYERRVGLTQDGSITQEFASRLREHPRRARLAVEDAQIETLIEQGRPKGYAQFVTELFDLHGLASGQRIVGEKSPNYVRHLPTLHTLWPYAKVVHLIRDGRDVALSMLDWHKGERLIGRFPTWQDDRVTTVALWWEWHVRLGREAKDRLGKERYSELSYESLVADPERECEKLCVFLGVGYDEAMLQFHEGRTKPKPGRGAKAAWLPVTAGLRNWKEQMRPGDTARFEAAAGDLLAELGYPTVAPVAGGQLEHAARLRAAFADHVRSRRRRVPSAWTVAA